MKRTDIKAGAVYGIEGSYGGPNPVVFLEDAAATLWQANESLTADRAYDTARSGQKPGKSSLYGARGYAIIRIRRGLDGKWDEALAALRAIDPAAELARFREMPRRQSAYQPGGGLLEFDVLTALNKVGGLYDDLVAADAVRREARQAEQAAADRRHQENSDRIDAAIARFAEFGIRASRCYSPPGVQLEPGRRGQGAGRASQTAVSR